MSKHQRGEGRGGAGRAVAAALAAATVLAGCSTFTSEDLKTLMGGVGQVAQVAGEYEAARRNGRSPGTGTGTGTGNAIAAQPKQFAQQAAEGGETAYAALSCARVTRRGSTVCMENSCGGVVMLHGRSGFGTYGPVALAAGQCAPVLPGTLVAVACKAGDRFDWQRSACVSS